jgi:hypothetical protein
VLHGSGPGRPGARLAGLYSQYTVRVARVQDDKSRVRRPMEGVHGFYIDWHRTQHLGTTQRNATTNPPHGRRRDAVIDRAPAVCVLLLVVAVLLARFCACPYARTGVSTSHVDVHHPSPSTDTTSLYHYSTVVRAAFACARKILVGSRISHYSLRRLKPWIRLEP